MSMGLILPPQQVQRGALRITCVQNTSISCHILFLMQAGDPLASQQDSHVCFRKESHIGHFKLGTIQMSSTVEWLDKLWYIPTGGKDRVTRRNIPQLLAIRA